MGYKKEDLKRQMTNEELGLAGHIGVDGLWNLLVAKDLVTEDEMNEVLQESGRRFVEQRKGMKRNQAKASLN